MWRAVAREYINEFAFSIGDDALVLLLCDLKRRGLNRLHPKQA
jgi:hypothetical protein